MTRRDGIEQFNSRRIFGKHSRGRTLLILLMFFCINRGFPLTKCSSKKIRNGICGVTNVKVYVGFDEKKRLIVWPTGWQFRVIIWKFHLTILRVIGYHNKNRAALSIWLDWRDP